jgi:hypothetical protein
LRTQAGQDSRRRVASCFVLTRTDKPAQVLGYYTLSALSIALTDLPSSITKRLPRYPIVPATLMGRLATDSRHRGKRLGDRFLKLSAGNRRMFLPITEIAELFSC